MMIAALVAFGVAFAATVVMRRLTKIRQAVERTHRNWRFVRRHWLPLLGLVCLPLFYACAALIGPMIILPAIAVMGLIGAVVTIMALSHWPRASVRTRKVWSSPSGKEFDPDDPHRSAPRH